MAATTSVLGARITRDPESFTYGDDQTGARFGLAWNTFEGGENKANFIDATVFGKGSKFLLDYGKKGSLISVTGELRHETWEKDGDKRSKHALIVRDYDLPKLDQAAEPVPAAATGTDDQIPF